MNYWLLLLPVFSAFTGWVIVRIGIWFLFNPKQSKKIAGINIQGIFPASQKQLAEKLGNYSTGLFSFDKIEDKISNPQGLQKILPMIENHIDDFLRNKLTKELPVIGMFVGDKTIGKVKETFMKEIELLFPLVMKQYAANMKQDFDIKKKISEKVAALSPALLEKALYETMGRELRLASLAGAAIGFIIGLLQLVIMLLVA